MIDIGSLIPSIIGLGAKVAGAVPGMKKPSRPQTAKEVAKAAGSHFGKAVGAAQSGRGFSRGLALREGIRGGMEAVEANSRAIGAAALADAQEYERRKAQRAENIANFTTDLAKGLGDMASIAVGPKSGGSDMQDPNRPEVDINPETGFGTPQHEGDIGAKGLGDLEGEMAAQEQVDQQAFMDDAANRLQDFKMQREEAGIGVDPQEAFQPDSTSKMIDEALQTPELAPEVEKELAQNLQMKKLMLDEAERSGLSLAEMLPRINRRLGLSAGQSLQNPFGVSTDLDVTGEA